ncbi:mediator of RNA polymerase II transcription subunit 16 isoform X3 [Cryptomeria japonica]|uniref:mediator of RNA polymerase II transcription subunit 16 isoform X3 n=1 Tax=Cryptomeria japonica TaxID=3369 RepID=UPI0025AC7155|nr:mediator of RNA polymerase II transcription subunit 16 isoform X3 [Cryptomeria japonica]
MNNSRQETDIQQHQVEEQKEEEEEEVKAEEVPPMKPCSAKTLSPDQQELDHTKFVNNSDTSPPFAEEENRAMAGTVYQLYLQQTPDSLQHKMTFPELCRKYSAIAWCGRLNVIACASETCARHPSSNVQPPFWIPVHMVSPERPTEHTVFNVTADAPCDFVQFIEWSPISCSRALLIANFNGRVNIWSQPTQGAVNLARAVNCWYCEHEWRQDLAVVTKWLSGMSPYRWINAGSNASANSKLIVEEKNLSHQPQTSGQYMSPHNPDEGPSLTGWRVQRWESSHQQVALHPLFENSSSNSGGQSPMTTIWTYTVNQSIPPMKGYKASRLTATQGNLSGGQTSGDSDGLNGEHYNPEDVNENNDVRMLAKIGFSGHDGEVAFAFRYGDVYLFSGSNFSNIDYYCAPVGASVALPAFSSTSCCLASVWHDNNKDCSVLKIVRILPPAVTNTQGKSTSAAWERAIADRFWWSLSVGVDWWDAVGCAQSAAEDDLVTINRIIAVLDSDFHSLPSIQHRQQYGPALDRIKCRLLEGTVAQDVRALVLDMQARLLLDMLGKGIESALINPATLIPDPWQASSETLSSLGMDAMTVDPALVPSIQAYVDAVLDLASHFLTRLRRYASFCRTLASHAVGVPVSSGSSRNMGASPTAGGTSSSPGQGAPGGTASNSGNTQMQAWVQGAIAKISSNAEGSPSTTPSSVNGPAPLLPLSVNTATFPGTPAVRLIGDCHFLHRLCQLLLFCLIFRRRQLPRFMSGAQRNPDMQGGKPQPGFGGKNIEELNPAASRPSSTTVVKTEDGVRPGQAIPGLKGLDEISNNRPARLGNGNAGQGYTAEEVKVLFLVAVDLCKRTSQSPHPLPKSQVGAANVNIRLHYIDGQYTVAPEVVEASLGPHMQNLPRPRGADAAGLLLRELELHPPAEDWHKRNMFGGPWSDHGDLQVCLDAHNISATVASSSGSSDLSTGIFSDDYQGVKGLWPRKRRFSERDAAFGLKTAVGMGAYLGLMGSRRDVITASWKTGLHGVWHKCLRCGRQTSALALPKSSTSGNQNNILELWWIGRWAYGCPMCGGPWVHVV